MPATAAYDLDGVVWEGVVCCFGVWEVGWVVPWFGGVPLAAAGAGVLSVVAGGDGWTGAVGVATFGLARYGGDVFTGVGW